MSDLPRNSGALIGGRYRLDARIGVGALAEVWRAVDEVLNRPVAVKLVHEHLAGDEQARAAVQREALAAARLHHPHIVSLYDTVLDEERPALVFELVHGRDLRTILVDGPLPPADVVRIGRAVADALDHVHRAGLVHGDVKPANVLLADDGRVLLADVGLARAAQTADTTRPVGDAAGTARYLAPEVLAGGQADSRSDLYSLGTLLFEAATGHRTFDAPTEAGAAVARLQRDPVRARQLRPDVPRSLDDLLHRLLRREPRERPADAAEVRATLDLAGEPAGPLPVPPPPPVAVGDRTPPSGVAPTFREAERTWLVPAGVIVLAAAGLGVVALVFGSTDAGRDLFRGARDAVGGPRLAAVDAAAAAAFDPAGDGSEHDDRAALAIDGDAGTTWTTETYRQPDFGTKPGVGLVVSLAQPAEVARIVVTSPTPGWAGEVMVAPSPATALEGWQPVAQLAADGQSTEVAVDPPAAAGAVLVWITDLGPSPHQVEIAEVEVRA